jgi:hypothetical protein
MKIIGTQQDGFICTLTNQEAYRLVGYHSNYGVPDGKRLGIGSEIQINAMYDQLHKVKDIKRSVAEIVKTAQELIDAVRVKSPVIGPVCTAIEAALPKDDR